VDGVMNMGADDWRPRAAAVRSIAGSTPEPETALPISKSVPVSRQLRPSILALSTGVGL
jgi:hypothetical protein